MERQRIPEHMLKATGDWGEEDWITEEHAAVLNADRVARGRESLNVLQWRLAAYLTRQARPNCYQKWRRTVERILEEARCQESIEAISLL